MAVPWRTTALGFGLLAGLATLASRFGARGRALESEIERLQDANWRLADSEQRYRNLVEIGLDLVVQRDAGGKITFANNGYAELVGVPATDLIGRTQHPVVRQSRPAGNRADGASLVDEAIETSQGLRWFAFVDTRVTGRDGALEMLRTGRDVTERVDDERRLEEARARAEAASGAKSRFLATVSHEFRTPLSGILGMADLVLGTALDPEQDTYVRAIKTSGEALLSLINEVLDFSTIEAGHLDLSAEPFDPGALVEGVVELLAPRAQGKGIEIAALIGSGLPRTVVGDADRLRQVLVNLAGNAVKFTEAGGVGIRVDRDPDDGEITVEVSDTGPGIAPERLGTIFEEFEQGEASSHRRQDGAGLGLAITRRIVEGMNGRVEVESHLGVGSAFRVRLPLPTATGPAPDASHSLGLAGKRVLILARSPFEAPFLGQRIEEAGGSVCIVETLEEGRAALEAAASDILIADCGLGAEVVRGFAQEARRGGIARCLVLLSPFDRRAFGSPLSAGFDGYLVKPVRGRSLLGQLNTEGAGPGAQGASARPRMPRSPLLQRGTRVLLAEDNEINALLALKALEKLGAKADWARNGFEALTLAEAMLSRTQQGYDLILMDIRMPGLDGLEATRRLRQLERALANEARSRVVALTANALEQDREEAIAAGLDGFLPKPLEIETLARLLSACGPPLAQAS